MEKKVFVNLRFLLVGLCLLSFQGCKVKLNSSSTTRETEDTKDLLSGVTDLDGEDLDMAKLICQSLEEKKVVFRNLHDGKDFPFTITSKDCSSNKPTTKEMFLRVEARPGKDLAYTVTGQTGRFISDILTSTEGNLKHFCPDILNDKPLSNTQDMSKEEKIQASFYRQDKKAKVSIKYYLKNVSGAYRLNETQVVTIHAVPGENNDYVGMEVEREIAHKCPGGAFANTIKQTLKQKIE